MQGIKLNILQRYRLRPQKKGKLPNFTKDFEQYTQIINKVIKGQVQWSFQFNKFGIEKYRKNSRIRLYENNQEREYKTQFYDQNDIEKDILEKGGSRLLRYNETKISPDHKIKTRQKSAKKFKQLNSSRCQLKKITNKSHKEATSDLVLSQINKDIKLPQISKTQRSNQTENKQNMIKFRQIKTLRQNHPISQCIFAQMQKNKQKALRRLSKCDKDQKKQLNKIEFLNKEQIQNDFIKNNTQNFKIKNKMCHILTLGKKENDFKILT